eukprot:GHVL01023743.1.p1 GENE.GHVL01023743.1~~GHVL01023743.1.p1  ORF type:complete len:413 (-),score=69.73 GHVL01023743.1:2228-3466(-)
MALPTDKSVMSLDESHQQHAMAAAAAAANQQHMAHMAALMGIPYGAPPEQHQQFLAQQQQMQFLHLFGGMAPSPQYGVTPIPKAGAPKAQTPRSGRRSDPTAAGYRPPPKKFHSRRTTFAPCHVAAAMSGKKVNSMAKRPVGELQEVLNSLGTGPRRTLQGLLRTDVHVGFCDDVIGWQRKPPSELYLRTLIDNIVVIIETQLELTKKRYLSGWKSVYDILRLVEPDTEVGQNHFRAFFTHVIGACDHLRMLPKNSGGRGRDNVLRQNLQEVISHVNSLRDYYAQRQAAGLPPVDHSESQHMNSMVPSDPSSGGPGGVSASDSSGAPQSSSMPMLPPVMDNESQVSLNAPDGSSQATSFTPEQLMSLMNAQRQLDHHNDQMVVVGQNSGPMVAVNVDVGGGGLPGGIYSNRQ